MADGIDDVTIRVKAIEYTEFAFSRLETKLHAGFGQIERKLDQFVEARLRTNDLVDRRLTRLEESA